MFERSERSERSEFRGAPRDRAPEGSLRNAQTAEAKRRAQPARAFAASNPNTARVAHVTTLTRYVGSILALNALQATASAAGPILELPPVEIVETTVLPGFGTPLNQIPANVQTLKAKEANTRRSLNISSALDQSASSVNVNDTAGSPFQLDVNFRGFTASPALGTPQGLSVFVDGVRVNETFGDTVNWDLIPNGAIASITVIPGSNPVFGLNTLGGAINVATKSGTANPGTSVLAYAGSFGRRAVEFESGGRADRIDYFVTGNLFRERGWGEHNPSRIKQLFGKAGYHDEANNLTLSATVADNFIEGNQSLPLSMLGDFRQSYSWPDTQTNRMLFVNLKADRHLTDTLLLEGNVYYRRLKTRVLNSNVSDTFDTAEPIGPGNQPTGNAINRIDQYRPGGALQLTSAAEWAGHKNQLTIGASVDRGRTEFTQFNQEAGASRDTNSNEPLTLATSLHAEANSAGLYATDNFGLNERTFLTLSARYNRATVKLEDGIGTALNGEHRFNRVNPAVGITFNPDRSLTTYAAYNEGMRVPTPVELTCADPNAPCSLPNAFVSDPALKPVVSKTFEIGARGRLAGGFDWSAAAFRTTLQDDLQFISSGGGSTTAGYFQNVGQTRRQGLELGLAGKVSRIDFSARYSFIAATFESPLVLNSPSHSSAGEVSCTGCAEIRVTPGDRIPGLPRHLLKLRGEYAFNEHASFGANLVAQSNHYARGDENNRDANGAVPGHAVVNLDARWRFAAGWEIFANVTNLFDRRYSTFGTLGRNVFTGPGNTFDASGASWRNEQFRSVGMPRGAWLGIAYRFGGAETSGN
jgi:iron complex outermembrane recepter protein